MPEYENEHNDEIDLVDYIQVLIRHKFLILASIICFTLVGAVFMWTNRTYQAQTLVLLSLRVEEKSEGPEQLKNSPGTQIVIPKLSPQTYEILATTSELNRNLRDTLQTIWPDRLLPGYQLNAEMLQETARTASQLLSLRVTSPDPALPVDAVNVWTRLFVERNRGLSSGVAQGYHEWVEKQYEVARKNLDSTQVALQQVQARYGNLNILQNEIDIKNSELDKSLQTYHMLEVERQSKQREHDFLQKLTRSLEQNGTWLGFLPLHQLPPRDQIASQPTSMQKDLVLLRYELAGLEQDSVEVFQKNEHTSQAFEAQAQNERLTFDRSTQLSQNRAQTDDLKSTIQAYRSELAGLKNKLNNIDLELNIYRQNLERQNPVLRLSKAITDEALWDQVADEGRVSKNKQSGLSQYRLETEEPNPVYQQLAARTSDLQIQKDLHEHRLNFLRREIPALQQDLQDIQQLVDSLQVYEKRLDHRLEDRWFALSRQVKTDSTALVTTLQRRREAFGDHRTFYLERKKQLENLDREIQRAQEDIGFQEYRFLNWQTEIRGLSTATDSLQMERAQLERSIAIYRETFERFSRLLEEARISLEQAAGDLQVISWATEISARSGRKYFLVIFVAGIAISIFLAFFLEYIQRARSRLEEESASK